jgi:hypothetical protein
MQVFLLPSQELGAAQATQEELGAR